MEGQPILKGMQEMDWFTQIRDWERLTETGDRTELTFLPDEAELWSKLDARRETCTGQKCEQFERCFITAMHRRAADADLIIVNHHLFFADLALRQDRKSTRLNSSHRCISYAVFYLKKKITKYTCY